MRKASKAPAVAAILVAMIFWGVSFISIKVAVAEVPPVTLALSRFLIAVGLLFLFYRIREPKSRIPARRDIPRLVLSGIAGITLYFFFENNGVKLTTASVASLIVATIPVLTLVGEVIFYRQKLTALKMAAVVLSFGGVYLVVSHSPGAAGFPGAVPDARFLLGCALMGITAVMWVVYNFLTRPLSGKYTDTTIVFYQNLFGTLALIPLSLMEIRGWKIPGVTSGLNILYLAVFCSAAGYLLYVYALGVLGVQVCALFINLIPVVTAVAGAIVLGERFALLQILGGVLVMGSVFLVVGRKNVTAGSA